MTNTTIFAIMALTSILVLGTSYVLAADHGDAPLVSNDQGADTVSLFPSWFNNNLQWYLDGQVDEMTLANAFQYLADEEIVYLDPDKATKVRQLEEENKNLKLEVEEKRAAIAIPNLKDVGKSGNDSPEQESLHHLRKAYDLNPNFQTKVVQFDSNHDKWIDVLSIDWGSSSSQDCSAAEGSSDENSSCWIRVSQAHAGEEIWTDEYGSTSSGDPDRPLITGAVPNPDDKPTEEVAFYYNKITSASETVHDLVNNGETSTTGWDEGVAAFTSKNYGTTSTSHGIHELGHALGVFCNVAIDKEIHALQAEISVLQDLSDMHVDDAPDTTRATGAPTDDGDQIWWGERLFNVDQKIRSLQTGLDVCEDEANSLEAEIKNLEEHLSGVGDDAQLANIDLQNSLQKQQQALQTMSNVSKMLHDTAMAVIRKIG